MDKRKLWFAITALLVTTLLFLFSGFTGAACLGMSLTVMGAVDFLFIRNSLDGWIASEAYGEAGEDLWEFRSFILMFGGTFVVVYVIIFN